MRTKTVVGVWAYHGVQSFERRENFSSTEVLQKMGKFQDRTCNKYITYFHHPYLERKYVKIDHWRKSIFLKSVTTMTVAAAPAYLRPCSTYDRGLKAATLSGSLASVKLHWTADRTLLVHTSCCVISRPLDTEPTLLKKCRAELLVTLASARPILQKFFD